MDIDLVSFVGYFIGYLFLGFVFFYFTLMKKAGSNIVGTICIVIVFVSLAIGFNSALHIAIINLFFMIMAFWFAYILMKMYRDDKIADERKRKMQQKMYQQRLIRKQYIKEEKEQQ